MALWNLLFWVFLPASLLLGFFSCALLFFARKRFGQSVFSNFLNFALFGSCFFLASQLLSIVWPSWNGISILGFALRTAADVLSFGFFFFAALELHDLSGEVSGA